ncbi:MAG: hypothetical protein O7J95_00090 [Planctomycetota bacterium]|nr:hypothetical protein [Planctomycetota bacterium]
MQPGVRHAVTTERPACRPGGASWSRRALSLSVLLCLPGAGARAEDASSPAPPPPSPGETPRELQDEFLERLQDPDDRPRSREIVTFFRRGGGAITRLYHGNVRWDFVSGRQRLRLLCDRLLVVVPRAFGGEREVPGDRGERREEAEEGTEKETEETRESEPTGDPQEEPPPDRLEDVLFYFVADGNVHVELPRQGTTIEAASLFYERSTDGSAVFVATDARLDTSVAGMRRVLSSLELRDVRGTRPRAEPRGFDALPLSLRARLLWTNDFEHFDAQGFEATTCDYEVPHFSLGAAVAKITPVRDGFRDANDVTIELEDTRFHLLGAVSVPMPLTYWDTRWHDYFPLRDVALGTSSKYGVFVGGAWNLNFLLKPLPLEKVESLERVFRRSRLDFETTFFEKRGFGYGPVAEYGTDPREWAPWQSRLGDWEYYGESRYFAINDRGEDRSSTVKFPDPDRFWATVLHRQSVPYLGIVDVEYSDVSDGNFLREYFESVLKEEKRQESLFSIRRNLRDNVALTGLFKYRTIDFESDVERLPEGQFLVFQQPVFDTGLYTDLGLQAANLRVRPADALPDPSRRFARFDALNEWSYPLSFKNVLTARPFAFVRFTDYSEVLDPARGGEDRLSIGAGVTASQQWSRTFDLSDTLVDRWFGVDSLKHIIVPKVTYQNTFVNDLEPQETFGLDEVDSVRLEEAVSLSLRQALVTRRIVERPPDADRPRVPPLLGRGDFLEPLDYTTRTLLDSEVSFVFFPREERDNDGDPLSLMIFDNTFHPGALISVRAWAAVDVNDGFRFDSTDASVGVDWWPGVLSTTVGDRFTRRTGDPRGDSHFVYGVVTARMGEKWRAEAFVAHDIDEGRTSEISVALVRVLHRFALIFEYSVDPGEDYNQSLSVNFTPLNMLRSLRRRAR